VKEESFYVWIPGGPQVPQKSTNSAKAFLRQNLFTGEFCPFSRAKKPLGQAVTKQTLNSGEETMYQSINENGIHFVVKSCKVLHTPAGNPVCTESEVLAARLVQDFKTFGPSDTEPRSILHFHYPMLDFVDHYPKQAVVLKMVLDLDPYNDWTLRSNNDPNLEERRQKLFGEPNIMLKEGRAWVEGLGRYQLCAALVLGRELQSILAAHLAAACKDEEEDQALIQNLAVFKPELGQLPLRELLANHRYYRSL
jgi:hypothetical protein